ncbi:MAG TPA: SDR family oxidoreductase [Polyangiaceae bacterium]|nr:SDR family oxidoreductase [Polyangiaceae bacterium]
MRGVSLAGKHAIVTGASSGLGVETARALSQAGANVVLAVRDVAAGERLAGTLVGAGVGRVTVSPLDLSDLASVNAFVERHRGGPLDLLVNNAGIMATPLGYTRQGLELQLGTNHVGHVALTLGLLPTLEQSSGARVVTVSSALHSRGRGGRLLETLEQDLRYERRKYVPFDAYGDSKLANVLFTLELARRLPPQVRAFSLHPGVIPTPLSRSLGVGGVLFRTLGAPFMKSVAQGAATSVFAATAPELDLHSGAYLSDCAIAMPSREATDPELAERVWRATEAFIKAR